MKRIATLWLVILVIGLLSRAGIAEPNSKYLPERNSIAWSPDLSDADIKKIAKAIAAFSMLGDDEQAREVLAPYTKDKRNVEVRYIYAIALAERVRIPESLALLKELSIEGYPYAIEAYSKERVCKLDKYEETCNRYGYNEVLKQAYLNWSRKDKLISGMYYRAFSYLPNEGYIGDTRNYKLTDESKKILLEGVKNNCYSCAEILYKSYFHIKNKNEEQKKQESYYHDIASRLLISGVSNYTPSPLCFTNKASALAQGAVCLNDKQYYVMLDNLSKLGKIYTYYLLYRLIHFDDDEGDIISKNSLYDYVSGYINEDYPLTKEIASDYKRAVKLNNGRGWFVHGGSDDIEKWIKLYNDKHQRSFWNKVNSLFD